MDEAANVVAHVEEYAEIGDAGDGKRDFGAHGVGFDRFLPRIALDAAQGTSIDLR